MRVLLLGLAPLLVGVACSSTTNDQGTFVRFSLPADGSAPALLDVPFPSDFYLDETHVVQAPSGFDSFIPKGSDFVSRELGALDGFSRIGFTFFAVDDPSAPVTDSGGIGWARVDPSTLPQNEADCASDTSAVFLVDLSAADPTSARVPCRAVYHDDTDIGSQVRPLLAIAPARGVVLRAGTTYAAVVTNRVRDLSQKRVGANANFDAARSSVSVYRDAYARASDLLNDALQTDHAVIVALTPFTTHTRVQEQVATRAAMDAMPVPPLTWDAASVAPMGAVRFAKAPGGVLPAGFTASLDDYLGIATAKLPDGSDDNDNQLPVRAHDHVAALGTAVFQATNYLTLKGDYGIQGDHTFARDASGHVVPSPQNPTQKIWVSIAVPDAPMPASGFPTVIIQHGLGSSRDYVLQLMNVFCARGWMALGIDSLTFGARAPEALYQQDQHSDYESAPGAKYKGPDGIADAVNGSRNGPLDLFGNLQNLGAFRDQLREASLDTSQLVRVLRNGPDLSPLATSATVPRIDPDRIAYFGESLGSVEGAVAAAIEPHVKLWTLSVAAGGILIEAGNHGPGIATLLGAGASLNFGLNHERLDQSHLITNLVQLVIEPADPLVFAPDILDGSRSVLQLEALYDELLANEGGEAFARAGGWGLALPNVGGNAGTRDLKDLAHRNDPVPLPDVAPDGAGVIHDTPHPGITAAVVQFGPGAHGSDIVSSKGTHNFAIPYARFDTSQPFTRLDQPPCSAGSECVFDVRNPYRALALTVTGFFADGFAGKVPGIVVVAPPVRDFDDDGARDDVDRDPSNPLVQ